MLSYAATPGITALRPPPKPAKGCSVTAPGQNNSVGIGNIFADSNIIAEGGLPKQYHVLALAGVMLNYFQIGVPSPRRKR